MIPNTSIYGNYCDLMKKRHFSEQKGEIFMYFKRLVSAQRPLNNNT